jgi:hypothetical protein
MNPTWPSYSILKRSLQNTTVDPESHVGEVPLREKFFTQLAPDIHRKFQKPWLVAKGNKTLDQLLQIATSIFYHQDLIQREKKGTTT